MVDYIVEPDKGIVISEKEMMDLPVRRFDLIFIVEPDPESYMPMPDDTAKLRDLLEDKLSDFEWEIDFDNTEIPYSEHKPETHYIWVRSIVEEVNYFSDFTDAAHTDVQFCYYGYDDLHLLESFLKGLYVDHPDWSAAVFGGMYEDEITLIANLIHQAGFSTTILLRYCISNQTFVNLDNLMEHAQWIRTAGLKKGESPHSLLDELDLDEDDEEPDDLSTDENTPGDK